MTAKRASSVRRKRTEKRKRVSTIAKNSKPTYSVRNAIFQGDMYDFSDYPADEYSRKYMD